MLLPNVAAGDAVGVNATHVVVGMTAPFSGLQGNAGPSMASGLRTAFAEANAAGGVQSRSLTLITMDDGYVASQAVANFPTLSSQALLLAGAYGTAVNTALLPLTVAANMPSLGPFTGAMVTRSPFTEQVINLRPSIPDEMVVQAILMVQQLRVHRIACLYQNDTFGLTALNSVTAALSHVGLQVMVAASYPPGTTVVEPALAAIAGNPLKAQAVVLASAESQAVKFMHLFRQDNRTDPDCAFLIYSGGVSSTFGNLTDRQNWPNIYSTQVVPPLDTPNLAIMSQYRSAAQQYSSSDINADPVAFQAYLVGRLIVQVLRGIPGAITRQAFLDELYHTRLYAFGGLLLGLYGRNFASCENAICNSSIGLRTVYAATLNPDNGAIHYNASLGSFTYSLTSRNFPVTNIVRPLLFGQLLPTDDSVWLEVAEAIGLALQTAFAALNAAGGVAGRPVDLVRWYYAGDAAAAAAALADRYALLAMVGSVVNRSDLLQPYAAAQIGTYQADPLASQAAYNYTEVQVQASLALELMALANFAYTLGSSIHLRAPNTTAGQIALQAMVQSLHSLQQQPASSRTYTFAAEALQGLGAGTVIAVGSDADVQTWFLALADLPQLRLLVPGPRAAYLRATLNVTDYPQAGRLHYPSMFGPGAFPAAAGPGVPDAALYGQLLADVLVAVLAKAGNASLAYTTTSQVLHAWYGSQYEYDSVTLGPYSATACSTAATADCECNEGVRQVDVLTLARPQPSAAFSFASATCQVVYQDLVTPPAAGLWYVAAIVAPLVAVAGLGVAGRALWRRGRRDNAAAPKDPAQPFCVVF
eukprot:EG_transcript_3406